MKKKILILMTLTFITSTLLVGCWGKNEVVETPPTTPPATTPPATTPNTEDKGINSGRYTGMTNGRYNNGLNSNYGNMGAQVGYDGNLPSYTTETNNAYAKRSERLAKEVEKIVGVDNAVCIVTGDTCYVGLNTANYKLSNNDSGMSQLKTQVTKKVKAYDTQVKNVVISTDASMMSKMRGVWGDLNNGTMGDRLTNSLNDMMK